MESSKIPENITLLPIVIKRINSGRLIGNLISIVIDIILVVKALPKSAVALSNITENLADLAIATLNKWGIKSREVVKLLRKQAVIVERVPTLELSNGYKIMKVGDEIVVLDKKGSKLGKLSST